MCERCEDEEQHEKIMESFEEQKNSPSCPLKKQTDSKTEEIERSEQFKMRYQIIAKMSKQLKECILSSMSYSKQIQELYVQLSKCDLVKDKEEIVKIIRTIEDYAQMMAVNDSVIEKTSQIIVEKTVGAS